MSTIDESFEREEKRMRERLYQIGYGDGRFLEKITKNSESYLDGYRAGARWRGRCLALGTFLIMASLTTLVDIHQNRRYQKKISELSKQVQVYYDVIQQHDPNDIKRVEWRLQ